MVARVTLSLSHLLCLCLHLPWLEQLSSPVDHSLIPSQARWWINPLCVICVSFTQGTSGVSSGHLSTLHVWSLKLEVMNNSTWKRIPNSNESRNRPKPKRHLKKISITLRKVFGWAEHSVSQFAFAHFLIENFWSFHCWKSLRWTSIIILEVLRLIQILITWGKVEHMFPP